MESENDQEKIDEAKPVKNDLIDQMKPEERRAKCIEVKDEGNEHFKSKDYDKANQCYIEALQYSIDDDCCDIRLILYSNLATSSYHQESYPQALDYANCALELNESHPKALLRRARIYKKLDQYDKAMADYDKYVQVNPDDKTVIPEIQEFRLEMNERGEKIKTEVMGKLKSFGNLILDKFGLSTDDFQMVKDPNTGGYSINFQPKGKEK